MPAQPDRADRRPGRADLLDPFLPIYAPAPLTAGIARGPFRAEPEEAMEIKMSAEQKLLEHLSEAERKAWESLARYKFQMFGYWAAIWVHLNRIGGFKRRNPWGSLAKEARRQVNVIAPIVKAAAEKMEASR